MDRMQGLFRSLALLGGASLAQAQSGAFTDGELLLRAYLPVTQTPAVVRIAPETGDSAVLATGLVWPGAPGGLVFDSHRGGVLCNWSMAPDNPFLHRLWFLGQDGSATAMPGLTGAVRALASAGDGRVYFVRHAGMNQGPKPVEYFDAGDTLHTLMQADGVTPFEIEVEHLLYHAPTNALIGSTSVWWSATGCAPTGGTIYRIPLSVDGSQVAGPVSCISISGFFANEEIMSLDELPGGTVLVAIASGTLYPGDKLLRFDPFTMGLSSYADPDQGDVNGAVWSSRLNRVVLHANWLSGGELRTFTGGQTGVGNLLSTTAPVHPLGGGYHPAEALQRIDANGSGCDGLQIAYGSGLAGKDSFVPTLGAIGCPDIGSPFTLSINDVVGGASGILFVGLNSGALPFKGGTFHLGSVLLQVPIAVGGAAGVSGAGSLALPALINDPILAGISIYLQAGFVDALAVQGVSLSNGLRLQGN